MLSTYCSPPFYYVSIFKKYHFSWYFHWFSIIEKNGEKFNFQEIAESIYKWDYEAIHRSSGALKRAEDSIYIDTTFLTEDELTKIVIEKIKEMENNYAN